MMDFDGLVSDTPTAPPLLSYIVSARKPEYDIIFQCKQSYDGDRLKAKNSRIARIFRRIGAKSGFGSSGGYLGGWKLGWAAFLSS